MLLFSGVPDQDPEENDDNDDDGIGNWKWIIPIIVLGVTTFILLMIIMYTCLKYKTLEKLSGQRPGKNNNYSVQCKPKFYISCNSF